MYQKRRILKVRSENLREITIKNHEKWKGNFIYLFKDSVFNELKVLRNLRHKNLMRLYEVYEDRNKYYFILELLQGITLHKEIQNRRKKN